MSNYIQQPSKLKIHAHTPLQLIKFQTLIKANKDAVGSEDTTQLALRN